jgi:hypothetical protein
MQVQAVLMRKVVERLNEVPVDPVMSYVEVVELVWGVLPPAQHSMRKARSHCFVAISTSALNFWKYVRESFFLFDELDPGSPRGIINKYNVVKNSS